MVQFDEKKQQQTLKKLKEREQEQLAETLSGKYGISYIDLSSTSLDQEALALVPLETAQEALIAPFRKKKNGVDVAVQSPDKQETRAAVAELERQGYTVVLYMASHKSLELAWDHYPDEHEGATKSGVIDIADEEITKIENDIDHVSDLKQHLQEMLDESAGTGSASRILEALFGGSLAVKSSDVHLEPEEKGIRLRLRIDGILQDLVFIDEQTYRLLLSRIKLVSGTKLNVRDEAQDGRFSFGVSDRQIEVRTSVVPGSYGESVVMRLLDPNNIAVGFEDLGINERLFGVIKKEINQPNGLILNTGPTGSGKTTSLYAFLNHVYTPEMKIITVENPVEYHLEGIVQTQVEADKGYTFLEGLRSALRQDPDVIMIGEIRDLETARTAINSALTGHLVLSTLHTNNAAGTIPRLIDLGVNPKIISSALSLSMAQRLARRLCETCKTPDQQNEDEAEIINRIIREIDQNPPENHGKIWRAGGCAECNNTGYKGRAPIAEGIQMDKNIENIIQQNPSEREITEAAQSQGVLTMAQDGILKILDGTTTISELQRVVNLFEE